MKEYKPVIGYDKKQTDQEKILVISSVIENAPYLLAKDYDLKLAGNSQGNSKGSSSSSSHSGQSSSSSASGATVSLENKF